MFTLFSFYQPSPEPSSKARPLCSLPQHPVLTISHNVALTYSDLWSSLDEVSFGLPQCLGQPFSFPNLAVSPDNFSLTASEFRALCFLRIFSCFLFRFFEASSTSWSPFLLLNVLDPFFTRSGRALPSSSTGQLLVLPRTQNINMQMTELLHLVSTVSCDGGLSSGCRLVGYFLSL